MIPRPLGRALAQCWPGPSLILVTDPSRLPDPLAAMRRLAPGDGVLLRHYDAPDRARLAVAVARLARRLRLVLLVAGDWRLAARLKARGLHLPEGLARHGVLSPALGWRRRSGGLLSVACHSPAALGRAKRLKADAALLSPAFPTSSHVGAVVIGSVRFGVWARRAGLPVIALGGIDRRTARRLPPTAACGFAAIGALA
ncbi:thiamine phosphate synthase [Paramagnetospirillum marisnigri]|uniref:Thiamine phosphate synthase n=1 Tax=Paramagnetospirillum marisnigri TaxID=1285242 RepID=A0A178MQB1_9PROT|nr:thiamine phosphate synthase [Paramagnetospirillum marisnigri]OAN50298.1 thiamine phosphate synthase [Paramagnetospirillum marisnigri]